MKTTTDGKQMEEPSLWDVWICQESRRYDHIFTIHIPLSIITIYVAGELEFAHYGVKENCLVVF